MIILWERFPKSGVTYKEYAYQCHLPGIRSFKNTFIPQVETLNCLDNDQITKGLIKTLYIRRGVCGERHGVRGHPPKAPVQLDPSRAIN